MKRHVPFLILILIAILSVPSSAMVTTTQEDMLTPSMLSDWIINQHPSYILSENDMILAYDDYYEAAKKAAAIDPEGKTVTRKGISRYIDYDDLTTLDLTLQKVITPTILFNDLLTQEDELTLLENQLILDAMYAESAYASATHNLNIAENNAEIAELEFQTFLSQSPSQSSEDLMVQLAKLSVDEANLALKAASDELLTAQLAYYDALGFDLTSPLDQPLPIINYVSPDSLSLRSLETYQDLALSNDPTISSLERTLRTAEVTARVYALSPALPIYATTQADYEIALAQIEDIRLELSANQIILADNINAIYSDIFNLLEIWPTISNDYAKATALWEEVQNAYNQGQVTTIDYLKDEVAYLKATDTYQSKLYDVNVAYLNLVSAAKTDINFDL